jgi:hypothetical protein
MTVGAAGADDVTWATRAATSGAAPPAGNWPDAIDCSTERPAEVERSGVAESAVQALEIVAFDVLPCPAAAGLTRPGCPEPGSPTGRAAAGAAYWVLAAAALGADVGSDAGELAGAGGTEGGTAAEAAWADPVAWSSVRAAASAADPS